MKIENYFKAVILGLLLGLITISPIYIFNNRNQNNKSSNIDSYTKDNIYNHVSKEQIVAKYGGMGLIQEVYQNNQLISIKCFACHNERVFICNSCSGSGKGYYIPRTVLVHSYVKRNGTRVRSHYRKSPGTSSRCYTCNGSGKIKCRNCQNYY